MEITEGKLREILDGQRDVFQRNVDTQIVKQREEYQHFVGIMKEDIDSKMQLIGEQYGTIKEMIGSLAEDVQIVKSDIEFIKGSLRKKVDYDEFQALEKRVATLEAKAKK